MTILFNCWISHSVVNECLAKPELADGIVIQQAIVDKKIIITPDPPVRASLKDLDRGEQTVLELAIRHGAYVLLDEKMGRSFAKQNNLSVVGTLGILLLAKQKQLIDTVGPYVERLVNSGYYLSEELVKQIVTLANE